MKKEQFLKKIKKKHKDYQFDNKKIKETEKLKIIGITGSHGKSSIAFLLNEYLKQMNFKTVLYSSISIDSKTSCYTNDVAVEVPINDDIVLYNAITEAVESDSDYLILEVNDRTIDLGICDDLDFDLKVLTNIEPLENQMYTNYVELKKSFITKGNHLTILGLFNSETIELYNEIKNNNVITYSTEYFIESNKIKDRDVSYYLKPHNNLYFSFEGLTFDIVEDNKEVNIKTNLNMPFHGLNLLCLFTIIKTLSVYDKNLYKKFVKNLTIPGRDEVIKYENGFVMISNTCCPQLEYLDNYRKNKEINRITLVCGSSGNIFPTWSTVYQTEKYLKQMDYDMNFAYNYATKYADKIIITTNDPGNNDIDSLLHKQEMLVKGKTHYDIIKNREEAIQFALSNIQKGEVVYISGRGNRNIFCEKDQIIKFLDKDVVVKKKGDK